MVDSRHEDIVSLTGEVRSADLNGRSFTLRLEDGTNVPCHFTPAQEAVITQALRDHATTRLHIKGRAEFAKPNGKIRRVLSVEELSAAEASASAHDPTGRPIWEVAAEIGASVPEGEWAKVPSDLSKNLDHYLYGAPKDDE